MGQARDQAGNIWETDAQGNAVRMVQAASGGRVVTLPPSPEKVREQQRQDAADARAATEYQQKQAEYRATHETDGTPKAADGALTPDAITFNAQQYLTTGQMPTLGMGKQAAADREAILNMAAKLAGASGLKGPDLARQIAHYKAGSSQLKTLETQLGTITGNETNARLTGQQAVDRSMELPGQTEYPTINSVVQFLQRHLPVPGHTTVRAMDSATTTFLSEYARVVNASPTGAGTLSDSARHEQMENFKNADSPKQKLAAFAQMKTDMENRMIATHMAINQGYQHLTETPGYDVPDTTAQLQLDQQNRNKQTLPPAGAGGNDPTPPPDNSPPGLPPANSPGGTDTTPLTPASGGGLKTVDHPEVRSMAASMVNAGAGFSTINAALKNKGFPPVSFAQFGAIQKWMHDNPGKAYPSSAVNANTQERLNSFQRASGSEGGAFLANMANSATAGIPVYLAGDKGKGAIDAMDALHPTASTLGNIVGGVTGAMGGEAAAAAHAPAALAAWAPRIADAGYGFVSGYTGSDGNLGDAALSAITAPIAGAAGERVLRGAGSALKGVTDPAVSYLRSLNIPMTAGQVAGGFLKSAEDKMTSIPVVGDIINKRRIEGLNAFNREGLNIAGEPIGFQPSEIGKAGVQQLLGVPGTPDGGATGRAYDAATAGVHVPFDGQLHADLGQFQTSANMLPDDLRQRAERALQNRVAPLTDAGGMTGDQYQQAIRGLKSYKAETTKPGFEQDYRDTLTIPQDALTTQMERGGGQDVVDGLRSADAAYRASKTVQNAADRADGSGYVFTPSQLQDALKVTQRKFPGQTPLTDLADNGQAVLPSKVPTSGTTERALIAGGLGSLGLGATGYELGGGEGATGGLALAAALAAGGSKPAQQILTKILLDRPERLRSLGAALQGNAKFGGGFGAGILAPLLVGANN